MKTFSVEDLYKTANLTYTSPVHRATPYLFGVSLGVILRYTGKNVKLYKVVQTMFSLLLKQRPLEIKIFLP